MNENDKLKEKLDLLSALKEDEELEKKKKKQLSNNIKKEKKLEENKKEKVIKEIKKVKEMTPKKKKSVILTIISFLALVISLTYLIYNIVKATDQINQPYLIINSACIFILVILLVTAGFISNKKISKKINTLNVSMISLYVLFQFLLTANIITIPTLKTIGDFSNMSINEVIKWANANKITLEQTYEYSDFVESNYIISQDLPSDTLLKDTKKIEVIVSNGPNYESIVNVPNMIGWNIDDVASKIKEFKLNNVNIEFNFNEVIEKDIEYEQSKNGEMRRNDELTLKFSLGNEADLKPVDLIDLIGKEEFDAVLWLKRNGIKYEISYEFSDKIESGKVISTTPEKGTLIEQNNMTVKLILSKGPKIVAPDLMKMSLEEITDWAIKNKVIIVYDSEYNSEIKAGDIIRVSLKEGDVIEENQKIYVVTSKGQLKMISYTDGDISALRNFAEENKLTLTENQEFNDTVEKGKFISVSKKAGDTINSGEEIKVVISLGKSTEVPNFIGMSASKAKTTCNNLGLHCQFSYVYSSKTKGNVFNQSMNAGSKVISNTDIILTVSNGTKTTTNNSSTNSNSGSNSTNSSNNNNPTTPTTPDEPPTPSCTEKVLGTLNIQESWLSIGSSSKTISSLKSKLSAQFPEATFNIVAKEHNTMGSGMIHPNSPANTGTQISSCKTYTIYVVE